MDNPQASATEMGWLVGILDGEGHVGMAPHADGKYRLYIKFVNTNPRIIEKLETILKKLWLAYHKYDANRTGNQRPAIRIEINGFERCHRFLVAIQALDFAKKEEAMAMLKYIKLRMSMSQKEPLTEEQIALAKFVQSRTSRSV